MGYIGLYIFAIVTFCATFTWWVSGFQGGSKDSIIEPVVQTAVLTAAVGGGMWLMGWLP